MSRTAKQSERPGPLVKRLNWRSHLRLGAMIAGGIAAGLIVLALGGGANAVVIGWSVACLIYVLWVWVSALRLEPDDVAEHATREDPSRKINDVLLITASVVSLGAIGFTLFEARSGDPIERIMAAVTSVVSIGLSWLLIHTLFTLRYARLYYTEPVGGIGFGEEDGPPHYVDFAYVAFTVGMTFQVSDTDLQSRAIRSAVLKHMLLSYLFGTVIVATIVNLVAGLS